MALVGINEGADPHEEFLRPAFSLTDCTANAAKSSLARQRVSRDASNTELSEVADTQEGSSEESVEWTPLAGGYTQATGQFPSLHSNCSLLSESPEAVQSACSRATSFEGSLQAAESILNVDPTQLLRRSFFQSLLELPERSGEFKAAITQENFGTRSPEEIRSLHRSFYTEPLEEVEIEIEKPESGFEVTLSAEWPPAKSCKALRTIVEEPMAAPAAAPEFAESPGNLVFQHPCSIVGHANRHSAVAVLRHGERQDSVWGSAWHNTEDSQRNPGDCPISDQAVLEARLVARMLRDFGDFGIIVSSPYLRCVQTAIAIADELDLVVLLDHELGEVFGPSVFGDVEPNERFISGHAWRSRKELYDTIKAWTPNLLQGFSKPPAHRVCWKKILGHAPSWGEQMKEARHRYAKRFLTYLSRGRRAKKNMIVVSHGIMVQTCLKVLPSTSAGDVAAIPYCGGLMAGFSRPLVRQCSGDSEEADFEVAGFAQFAGWPKTPSQELPVLGDLWPESDGEGRPLPASESEHLEQAHLQGWDVRLLGVDFDSGEETPRTRASLAKRYQDLLTSLKAGSFSWAQLQLLLGDLPTELPAEAFQTVGPAELSDTATQISMELFRSPPKFAPNLALEETSPDPPSKVEQDSVKTTRVPQLNLRSSLLMGRRVSNA